MIKYFLCGLGVGDDREISLAKIPPTLPKKPLFFFKMYKHSKLYKKNTHTEGGDE